MNIFKEMALSVYSYKSYQEFLKNRKSKVFAFGVVLMLIYFIITTVAPFMKFEMIDGGIGGVMEEYIPDFELQDGYLWVEEVIELEEDDVYIWIDTDPEYYFYGAEEMTEYLYGYSSAILMDSEKVIVKDDGVVQELYFADLDMDFSKADLLGFVPYINIIIVIVMIIMYLFKTAFFFFGVLFVALLGMIAASCMKCELTFGQLYMMGIYSRTLPLIIKAVLTLVDIDFFAYNFISIGISLIILICAMRKMKEVSLEQPLKYVSEDNYFDQSRYNYWED